MRGILLSVLSTLALVYVPALSVLFHMTPLNTPEWTVAAISCLGFLAMPEIFMRKPSIN